MAAKVKWDRGAWWVVTHYSGKRKRKRVGSTNAHKLQADEIAKRINAKLALGEFAPDPERERRFPCDAELRQWHRNYAPTMKHTYEVSTLGIINHHLVPFFGTKDIREIREDDLLAFARSKLDEGLAPKTISNALGVLRRVLYLAQRDEKIGRNPAARVGDLMRRIDLKGASQVREVSSFTRNEAETLVGLAREHEPRLAPLLVFLLSTGCRRGEALGLQWGDVDLERRRITIRRSYTLRRVTTPKSGRSRRIPMTDTLASELFDVLALRRRETLERGWPEVPEWVFCSIAGTAWDDSNLDSIWRRLRRRAQQEGVRPLRLHDLRHTWATWALESGKSVRWVADCLGHADPALTLRVYAHAMQDEEVDLSFAELKDGPRRPYTAPATEHDLMKSPQPPDIAGGPRGRGSRGPACQGLSTPGFKVAEEAADAWDGRMGSGRRCCAWRGGWRRF
jgi:integrase